MPVVSCLRILRYAVNGAGEPGEGMKLNQTCRTGLACLSLLALAVLPGCSPSGRYDSELRDPMIRQARARAQEGNKDMALAILNRALARKPNLGQAHLDAALLYDRHKQDYIRAIYHYGRFLELQPAADKRTMIEELIRQARMAYGASVVDQEYNLDHRIRQLREENELLKQDLREVRANLAQLQLQSRGAAAPTAPSPVPPAAAPGPASAGKSYQVQPGDTLTKIAARLYQNPRKWTVIFEANRDKLTGPEKLAAGQILRIPPEE